MDTYQPLISIYKLVYPETREVKYIGQTIKKISERLTRHCNDKRKCYTTNWILSLKEKGLKPIIVEICQVRDQYADDIEIRLIEFYRSLGYNLTNHHDGGQKNRKIDKETGRKIS